MDVFGVIFKMVHHFFNTLRKGDNESSMKCVSINSISLL